MDSWGGVTTFAAPSAPARLAVGAAARPVLPTAAVQERERALDTIRSFATVRVIVWHSFGIAAITYLFAAMPAMFFVSGSLLAKSFARRGIGQVLRDRVLRLLVPLWAFGTVAWTAMVIAARHEGRSLELARIWTWVLPVGDPHGTDWEAATWLAAPLWYLRAILWLLAASPLLWWAVRRHRVTAFALPVAAVFALDLMARRGFVFEQAPRLLWQIGDFALYSCFFSAGFVHRDGGFARLRAGRWVLIGSALVVLATLWRLTQPVPLGVVNNSHPLHLLVGAAWLSYALAAQPLLARAAQHRVLGRVVRVIAQRAYTIYLWHTTVIFAALEIVDRAVYPPGLRSASLLALVTCGTLLAIVLFGWIEDLSARRRPRLWPHDPARAQPRRHVVRLSLASALAAGLVAIVPLAVLDPAPTDAATRRPPVPSRQPPLPGSTGIAPSMAFVPDDAWAALVPPEFGDAAGGAVSPDTAANVASLLQLTLEQWSATAHVPGVAALVAQDTQVLWSGAVGIDPVDRRPASATARVDAMSITKMLTAALVFQEVDGGRIALDAPVPLLGAVGVRLDARITPRLLLTHRSGLVNYRDLPTYQSDPASVSSPAVAVRLAAARPLQFAPGSAYAYSSTGYLVLGLLLEQVTGRTFDELLRDRIFAPLALTGTTHDAPRAGEPNQGSSGLVTDLADLTRLTTAVVRDHLGFGSASASTMTDFDPTTGVGAGLFAFCPCTTDAHGTVQFASIGHFGGTTIVAYVPDRGLSVAINVTDTLWVDGRPESAESLVAVLAAIASSR